MDTKMDTEIGGVRQDISKVQQQIDDVERELKKAVGEADVAYWRKEEEQLREEKLVLLKARSSEGEPSSMNAKRSRYEIPSLAVDHYAFILEQECYFNNLLEPPPVLPRNIEELWTFLDTKRQKLPIRARKFIEEKLPTELVSLCSSEVEAPLADVVGYTLEAFKKVPSNEAGSSILLWMATGEFLRRLDTFAPPELKLPSLKVAVDSNRHPDSISVTSTLLPMMRPDFSLFLRGVLILRWENKIDLAESRVALRENAEKLKVWSPLYYGQLPYVIGGYCDGSVFGWLKLSLHGPDIAAEPISKLYYLDNPSSLLEFLHSVVQMYRLLLKLQEELPKQIPVSYIV